MRKFWDYEDPITIRSEKNVLRYYPQADQLQISRQDWQDDDGVTKKGKTVTLNIEALAACDEKEKDKARSIFQSILDVLQ